MNDKSGAEWEGSAFLRNILESSQSISIISTDLDHNILYWNAGAENIFGYTADEMVGKQKISLLYSHKNSRETLDKMRSAILDIRKGVSCEVIEGTKDGRHIWINLTLTPRFDEDGNLVGMLGIGEDITERKRAESALKASLKKSRRSLSAVINALEKTIETRDPYTAGHQRRVANLGAALAKEMNLSIEQVEGIHMAGVVHDLGKISVPAEILSWPGRFSKIQFDMIKSHARVGYDILKGIEFPWPVAEIAHQHHERIDGSGYPQGLKGDDICLDAKILGVADVVEAMASHRPYRPALGIDVALGEVLNNRDELYDPDVVDACMRLFKEKGYELV